MNVKIGNSRRQHSFCVCAIGYEEEKKSSRNALRCGREGGVSIFTTLIYIYLWVVVDKFTIYICGISVFFVSLRKKWWNNIFFTYALANLVYIRWKFIKYCICILTLFIISATTQIHILSPFPPSFSLRNLFLSRGCIMQISRYHSCVVYNYYHRTKWKKVIFSKTCSIFSVAHVY